MDEIFQRVPRFPSDFLEEVEDAYITCSGVANIAAWLRNFEQLSSAVERGTGTYRQVEDHIFELKVVHYIIDSFDETETTYEPSGIAADGKDIDLEVLCGIKRYLVEVKSFHPEPLEASIPEQFIAKNNIVVMDGESYHSYQAMRGLPWR